MRLRRELPLLDASPGPILCSSSHACSSAWMTRTFHSTTSRSVSSKSAAGAQRRPEDPPTCQRLGLGDDDFQALRQVERPPELRLHGGELAVDTTAELSPSSRKPIEPRLGSQSPFQSFLEPRSLNQDAGGHGRAAPRLSEPARPCPSERGPALWRPPDGRPRPDTWSPETR